MQRTSEISILIHGFNEALNTGTDIKLDMFVQSMETYGNRARRKQNKNETRLKSHKTIFYIRNNSRDIVYTVYTIYTDLRHKQMVSDNIFYYHAPSSRSLSAFCPLTASIQPYLPRPYIPLFPRFILFPFSSISLTFRFVFFSNRRKTVHIQCVPHLITFHT